MRDHRIQILLCVLLLTMSVAMTGCGEEEADAQVLVPRVVETFVMDPGTFFIDANQAPTVVVGDQFTQYTMTDSTIIRFNLATGVLFTRVLQVDEVVIERPGPVAGLVTIIHRRG
ncbi:MAG: hypothetical protein ACM335_02275 [Deltaproteobacteria bacterium]